MTHSALPQPRKRPRQSRSQLLVDAISEACVMILEREGAQRLTTQRIADVAGINIASLYRYFPNKDAVLAEVFERRIVQYLRETEQRLIEIETLSKESLEKTLAAIISMQVDQHLHLRTIEPEFYSRYAHGLNFHERANTLSVSLDNLPWNRWFTRLLTRHRDRLREGDLALLSHVARSALDGAIVAACEKLPESVDSVQLKQELLQLALRYLLREPDLTAEPAMKTT